MHAFFALHFGSNLCKHVFSPGTLAPPVTEFYNCFTLFLKVDQVIVGHILRNILKFNLFGNLILPSIFDQPNRYVYLFVFLLLCSDLFGVTIIYKV